MSKEADTSGKRGPYYSHAHMSVRMRTYLCIYIYVRACAYNGFRVWDLAFEYLAFKGLGFRVSGFGFRVEG